MKRIHKKLRVTSFGRGGGAKRVLFEDEAMELHILHTYIERIYVNLRSSVESKAIRPSAGIMDRDNYFFMNRLTINREQVTDNRDLPF